jgi:hypothetical protein
MNTKRILRCSTIALAAFFCLLLFAACPLWLLSEQLFICSSGSPRLARGWVAQLDSLQDLECARQSDKQIEGQRFPDGEWVFGLSQNSHGSPLTGGTLVVKDSRQRVRVFFGHVCGGPNPRWWELNFTNAKSLDEFYGDLAKMGFTEYKLPGN